VARERDVSLALASRGPGVHFNRPSMWGECYEFAAEARAMADASNDPATKAEWLNAEKRWLGLARVSDSAKALKISTQQIRNNSSHCALLTSTPIGPSDLPGRDRD
jgi:hypothetical protein